MTRTSDGGRTALSSTASPAVGPIRGTAAPSAISGGTTATGSHARSARRPPTADPIATTRTPIARFRARAPYGPSGARSATRYAPSATIEPWTPCPVTAPKSSGTVIATAAAAPYSGAARPWAWT